ncbi:MAG: hypothetical protein H6728_09515 [Myxococcales bacterium]|nr:hypothetical protein [Myxococcales bacterium]
MSRKISLFRLLCGGLLLCCAGSLFSQAEAYLLPSRFYLRKMVSVRSLMRRLKVSMTVDTLESGKMRRSEAVLWLRAPGQIRLEYKKDGKNKRVEVWRKSEYVRWDQGGQAQTAAREPNPLFDFFAIGGDGVRYGRVQSLLALSGVNFEGTQRFERESDYNEPLRMSFSWFVGRPVVVFGAPFGKRKPNQLWIDKEHAYPARFLGRLKKGGVLWDIRFLDYHRSGRGYLFPGRIEVYRDGKLTKRFLSYRVEAGASVAKTLFDQVP